MNLNLTDAIGLVTENTRHAHGEPDMSPARAIKTVLSADDSEIRF